MNDSLHSHSGADKLEERAANWVWRLDRGLSAEEQDAFFDWLVADPQNAEVLARHRRNWKRLDKLADWRPEHAERPNPDLLAPDSSPRWNRRVFLTPLAAAAALAAVVGLWSHFSGPRPAGEPEMVVLEPKSGGSCPTVPPSN